MEKVKLDELQLKIMQVLWQQKEASVQQIREYLPGQKDLAITTISTVLSRLEKKGIVSFRKEGRLYIYKPEVMENEVKQSMVSSLVERLFKGDHASLVNFLVNEADIDPDQVRKLKDKLKKLK